MQRHHILRSLSRDHRLAQGSPCTIRWRLQRDGPDADLRGDLGGRRDELAAHFATEESIGREALLQCPEDEVRAGQLDRIRCESFHHRGWRGNVHA